MSQAKRLLLKFESVTKIESLSKNEINRIANLMKTFNGVSKDPRYSTRNMKDGTYWFDDHIEAEKGFVTLSEGNVVAYATSYGAAVEEDDLFLKRQMKTLTEDFSTLLNNMGHDLSDAVYEKMLEVEKSRK